jgi:hypothetical protein
MRDLLHKYPAPESVGNRKFVFGVEGGVTFPLTKHEQEVSDLIEDLAEAGDPSGLDTNN